MGGILGRYDALLLDLNGTFMFGQDRFGPAEDYHATYRTLGGARLTAAEVRRAVDECYGRLAARYEDPARADDFPSVPEALAGCAACAGLPAADLDLVEAVFAEHELGRVPEEYAAAVRRLARTHRLAVVTDLWSAKGPWLAELRRAGVLDRFVAVVASSDGRSVKPSAAPFRRALAALGVPARAALVVGDSLRRDVGGAAAAGLDAAWINPAGAPRPAGSPVPAFEVRSLLDLAAPVLEPG